MTLYEALEELQNGTEQRKGEKIEQLGQRIQILVSKAYPNYRGKDKTLMERWHFLNNMTNKEMVTNLTMICDEDLPFSELVIKAAKAVQCEKTAGNRQGPNLRPLE